MHNPLTFRPILMFFLPLMLMMELHQIGFPLCKHFWPGLPILKRYWLALALLLLLTQPLAP